MKNTEVQTTYPYSGHAICQTLRLFPNANSNLYFGAPLVSVAFKSNPETTPLKNIHGVCCTGLLGLCPFDKQCTRVLNVISWERLAFTNGNPNQIDGIPSYDHRVLPIFYANITLPNYIRAN